MNAVQAWKLDSYHLSVPLRRGVRLRMNAVQAWKHAAFSLISFYPPNFRSIEDECRSGMETDNIISSVIIGVNLGFD